MTKYARVDAPGADKACLVRGVHRTLAAARRARRNSPGEHIIRLSDDRRMRKGDIVWGAVYPHYDIVLPGEES